MYDIILDPSLDGCMVWCGNSFFKIKGKPDSVSKEIHDRVIVSSVVDGRRMQPKKKSRN